MPGECTRCQNENRASSAKGSDRHDIDACGEAALLERLLAILPRQVKCERPTRPEKARHRRLSLICYSFFASGAETGADAGTTVADAGATVVGTGVTVEGTGIASAPGMSC